MANSILDEEGENQAVRCFLRFYGQPGLTVEQMRKNMQLSGYPFWPKWVDTTLGHLTKAGAQLWLRYLFALENRDGK